MRIDPSSPSPVFLQIAEQIRGGIASGVYRPGDLIPSIRETALRLLVNPNTVKRAYEELERDGYVVAKKGIGMVVQESTARPAMRRAGAEVQAALVQAIGLAGRAGMDRGDVDGLYEKAWSEAAQRQRAAARESGGARVGKESDQ